MTKQDMDAMANMDEAAEQAGGYLSPSLKSNIHYDYRKIMDYCKAKGIDPRDMTIRELDSFVIPS